MQVLNALSWFWIGHPDQLDINEGKGIEAWSKQVIVAFEVFVLKVKEELQSKADKINKLNQKMENVSHSGYIYAKDSSPNRFL